MIQQEIKDKLNSDYLRAPMLRDITAIVLMLLSSRASLLGMFPFGVAFFAACFDKSIAYIGIGALGLSLFTTTGRYMVVKYLLAALTYWIYTKFTTKKGLIWSAAGVALSLLFGGGVFLIYSYTGVYDILLLFAEAVITGMMYIIFHKARAFMSERKNRTRTAQDELISIAVSTGVFITGLSGIVFPFNISLCDVLSVYATLCITLNTSLAAAGSGGLCIGFLASMSSPTAIVTMGIFGISALFSNLLKSFGKYGAALGFIGGSAVALLYAGNVFNLPISLTEVIIGAALFILTPNKYHKQISSLFTNSPKIEEISTELRAKQYLTMRLEKTASAFKSLEECFESVTQKRLKSYGKDVAELVDETASRVCDGCKNAPRCWQKEFTATYRGITRLLETMEKQGILTMDNVPNSFIDRCIRVELFVMEFNHVYELYKQNLIRMGEATEGRDLMARQYREVSLLMDDMAQSITEGFDFRESSEEEITTELDKIGIAAFDVSVIENGEGKIEVYMSVNKPTETDKITEVLENVLLSPMVYDGENTGTLMRFVSRARYSVDIGIRQVNRDYSEVSGDSVESFMADNYKHYVIISDGMGSGRKAKSESKVTIKLLKEFLMSGFGVRTAVDIINSALCLKLDDEYFSTVDILCIDLMTGICEFFKIGSAESIIMHGANVETVFSVSLPVGMISEVHTEGQAKRLTSGDTILMMSDGVTEAGLGSRTDWIKTEIQKPYIVMDDMAAAVIEAAIKKSRDSVLDDMTVAAVRLVEN